MANEQLSPEFTRKIAYKLGLLQLCDPNTLPEFKLRKMYEKAYSQYRNAVTREGGAEGDYYTTLISETYTEKEAIKRYAKEKGIEL